MSAIIGALRVNLGLDIAAFETNAKRATSIVQGFERNVKLATAAVTVAAVGAATAAGVAIKKQIDQMDQIGKVSQSIGVPVEELSKLQHAADLSGVSLESLSGSLGKLAKNMVESATNGTSAAARSFEALGISVTNSDGSLKSQTQTVTELAGKFEQFADSPTKTAHALALLGKSGKDMIPLLNLGKDGLQEMMKEAEALGLVISTKTAKAAEEFNDNLTRLHRVFDGIVTQVAGQLAPALAMFSGALVTLAKNSDHAKGAADGIVAAIKGAVEVAYTAGVVFRRLGAELSALWELLKSDNLANTRKMWANFVAEGDKTAEQLKAIPEVLKKFWSDAEAAAANYSSASGTTRPSFGQAKKSLTR